VSTTATIEVDSPFTGELVGEAPVSSPSQVRDALDAAATYESELSRHERSQLLFAVAGRLNELALDRVREAIRAMSFTKLYTLPWG
jgi:acyl-CoA reductase-like NAD-dependent aldehyde dehydrogenase